MTVGKAVSALYFAALDLLDALDEAGLGVLDDLVLQEPELEDVARLRVAVTKYQEEVLTNGSDN